MRCASIVVLALFASIARGVEDEADPPHALLAEWVRAQNAGDFSAYEKLYVDHFHAMRGAKGGFARVDGRTWMAEHRQMFAAPHSVAVDLVRVLYAGKSTLVTFRQTTVHDGHEDSEFRTFWLIKAHGALRIASDDVDAPRAPRCGSTVDKGRTIIADDKPPGASRWRHVVGETTVNGVRRSVPVQASVSCYDFEEAFAGLRSDPNGNISFWTNYVGQIFVYADLEARTVHVRRGETAPPPHAPIELPKGLDAFFGDHAHVVITPDARDTLNLGALDSFSYSE